MDLVIANNTLSTNGLFIESMFKKFIPNNFEYTSIIIKEDFTHKDETIMCMELSEKSLSKEWENENDAHWESFLK